MMDSQDFVELIELHVGDAAVSDVIANLASPPGRGVPQEVRIRSEWFNQLDALQQDHVEMIVKSAVRSALFGVFAVLDGARTVTTENGRFELFFANEQKMLLNPESVDLHDLMR